MSRLLKILRWTGIVIAVLGVAGILYQQIGLALDKQFAPTENAMFVVAGRKAHVVCSGVGSRTFLLDAGAGAWSSEWYRVQPLLARNARVCSFDRAGLGWSDPSADSHDGNNAAQQLHDVVAAANIPTPFIYVGHSLGANLAQIYYARYPKDVAGMVLIEPGDPRDLLEDFHGSRTDAMQAPDCDARCAAADAATFLGLTRLATLGIRGGKNLSGLPLQEYRAGLARPATARTLLATLGGVPKVAYEDLGIKSFGRVPVLTFMSTEPRPPEGKETVADVRLWRVRYTAFLTALAAKSAVHRGPIDVPHSNHTSMVMGEPQAVFLARTIEEFVRRDSAVNAASKKTRH